MTAKEWRSVAIRTFIALVVLAIAESISEATGHIRLAHFFHFGGGWWGGWILGRSTFAREVA